MKRVRSNRKPVKKVGEDENVNNGPNGSFAI
jgi:hypothetical protein